MQEGEHISDFKDFRRGKHGANTKNPRGQAARVPHNSYANGPLHSGERDGSFGACSTIGRPTEASEAKQQHRPS